MKELTDKQKEVLDVIKEFTEKKGYQPSLDEIGEILDKSRYAVYQHIKAAEKKGFVAIMGFRAVKFLKEEVS